MSGFLCAMVGATFATVTVAAQVLRSKKGITAVGNAQVDTAQSYFGGASFQSDGAGDYLQIAPNSEFAFTGDFTVECFLRFSAHEQYGGIFSCANPGSSQTAGYQVIFNNTADSLYVGIDAGSFTSSSTLSTNTWYHIALVRSSGVFTLYINGTSNGTLSNSATMSTSTYNFYWGTERTAGQEVTGHFDEMRVSKTARYTAAFVVPTLPFVNDDNTVLLIHANGTDGSTFFEDDNGATTIRTAKTITANGNAQLSTAQEKFGQSSVLFDGTGDYLELNDSADWTIGTGNYTVEMWVKADSASMNSFAQIGGQRDSAGSGTSISWAIFRWSTGTNIGFQVGEYESLEITGVTVWNNAWHHLALVRNGTSVKLYIDGTSVKEVTLAANYSVPDRSTKLSFGRPGEYNGQYFTGYMDEIRISNVARYTANFTAPTATFENDANTLLLIHADGADASVTITDDNSGRSPASIYASGNAVVSTTQSKFGSSSAYFDGTGDFLTVATNQRLADLMLGDFTIEFWMYSPETGIDATYGDSIMGVDNGGSGSNGWIIKNYGSKLQWVFDGQGGYDVATFNPSANTWHHIAFVRSGTTLKCYTDGTERTVTSYSDRKSNSGTYNLRIGKVYNSLSEDYTGYLDEIRISNTARYTAAFTAPTAPFVNDADTTLLIHADGTNGSTVFRDDNGIQGAAPKTLAASGNAQLSTAQYKFGTSSLLLDGNGDYLTVTNAHDFNFQKNDFTIEAWVRFDALATSNRHTLISNGVSSFTTGWIKFSAADLGAAYYPQVTAYDYSSGGAPLMTSSTAVTNNTWYHIAWVRSGTNHYLYLDGTQVASNTNGTAQGINVNMNLSGTQIGRYGFDNGTPPSATYMDGYIDEMRISNVARYTAAFTPSTTAFTKDGNTLFLSHFEGANASTTFVDDGGRTQKGVSAIANAQIDTAQSKFGGSSALFDGTGDYLLTPGIPWHASSAGTMECWFRLNSTVPFAQGIMSHCTEGVANAWQLGIVTNKLYWWPAAPDGVLVYDFTLSTNTWYHIAVVKESSSVLKIYVDGTLRYTNSSMGSYTDSTSNIFIGRMYGTSSGLYDSSRYDLNGWMDEVRISNNARYTAGFTPSTTPFQNDDNTVLLLHMDGTDASTVFFDDNGAKPYTP